MTRQSVTFSASSTGTVAATMPMPPAKNIQPFIAGSRCAGNQRTLALIPDIKHPDTPSPIRARPSASVDTLPAAANRKAAAGRHHQQGRVGAAGAKTVEQQPERKLERREGQKICAGEQSQLRGGQIEPGNQVGGNNGVDRAVQVRQDIREREGQQDPSHQGRLACCAHRAVRLRWKARLSRKLNNEMNRPTPAAGQNPAT